MRLMLRARRSMACVGVLTAVVMPVLACTAEAQPDTSTKADPVKPVPKRKAPSTAGPTGSTSPAAASAAAAADAPCKAQKGDACSTCCEKAHPAGAEAWQNLYDDCICDNARCAAACAKTECSDDDAEAKEGDACDLCMKKFASDDGTGLCDTGPRAACAADAECKAFLACDDECD
jgi:hypothetical protein